MTNSSKTSETSGTPNASAAEHTAKDNKDDKSPGTNDKCPCGTDAAYNECCAPLHRGDKPASTALELMRSRYCAFVKGEINYLLSTTHPQYRKQFRQADVRTWSENSEWHGLEIVKKSAGGKSDQKGIVEFIAHFSIDGQRTQHHERAEFKRLGPRWYFCDGLVL